MYYSLNQDELRIIAKNAIENFELWARRFIDIKLIEKYGKKWNGYVEDGKPLINKKLNARIKEMLQREPLRFSRAIDTLFIEDIISLLCRNDLYNDNFKDALKNAYPQGNEEAREFLMRLVPIRNKLNHAWHISVRESEKAICYANDFIDCLKEYYVKEGCEKVYNVPLIVRIADSCGNEFMDSQISRNSTGRGHCSPNGSLGVITAGESFSIEANVDPSFEKSTYSISWLYNNQWIDGNKLTIILSENDIRMDFTLYCRVISNQHTWHRCGDVDDCVSITYKVVPPVQ